MLFEWDESKRQSNLAKHRLVFKMRYGFLRARCSKKRTAVMEKTAYWPSVLSKALRS
jgi:uncharacterized DUF497 family protein